MVQIEMPMVPTRHRAKMESVKPRSPGVPSGAEAIATPMTRGEVDCGMKPETISGRARQAAFKAKAMLSGALIVPSVVTTVIVTGLLFLMSPL